MISGSCWGCCFDRPSCESTSRRRLNWSKVSLIICRFFGPVHVLTYNTHKCVCECVLRYLWCFVRFWCYVGWQFEFVTNIILEKNSQVVRRGKKYQRSRVTGLSDRTLVNLVQRKVARCKVYMWETLCGKTAGAPDSDVGSRNWQNVWLLFSWISWEVLEFKRPWLNVRNNILWFILCGPSQCYPGLHLKKSQNILCAPMMCKCWPVHVQVTSYFASVGGRKQDTVSSALVWSKMSYLCTVGWTFREVSDPNDVV